MQASTMESTEVPISYIKTTVSQYKYKKCLAVYGCFLLVLLLCMCSTQKTVKMTSSTLLELIWYEGQELTTFGLFCIIRNS